jgi:hypothetical protein
MNSRIKLCLLCSELEKGYFIIKNNITSHSQVRRANERRGNVNAWQQLLGCIGKVQRQTHAVQTSAVDPVTLSVRLKKDLMKGSNKSSPLWLNPYYTSDGDTNTLVKKIPYRLC